MNHIEHWIGLARCRLLSRNPWLGILGEESDTISRKILQLSAVMDVEPGMLETIDPAVLGRVD